LRRASRPFEYELVHRLNQRSRVIPIWTRRKDWLTIIDALDDGWSAGATRFDEITAG